MDAAVAVSSKEVSDISPLAARAPHAARMGTAGIFVRVHCDACGKDRLVAFSCKGRGFCPSCGGRRMADTAAWLVDRVLPFVPVRQWVHQLIDAGELPCPCAQSALNSPLTFVYLPACHRLRSARWPRRPERQRPPARPMSHTHVNQVRDGLFLREHPRPPPRSRSRDQPVRRRVAPDGAGFRAAGSADELTHRHRWNV
jgi:transposase-like zinc-binding protein